VVDKEWLQSFKRDVKMKLHKEFHLVKNTRERIQFLTGKEPQDVALFRSIYMDPWPGVPPSYKKLP